MDVSGIKLDVYQQSAFDQVIVWYKARQEQTRSLGGLAGTGKSTLIKFFLDVFPRAAVAAFTGKAVHTLKSKGIDRAQTLHKLLYECVGRDRNGQPVFEPIPVGTLAVHGLVIVDEASMVPRRLQEDLLKHNLPVLWVGDHGQLPPIGADSVNLVQNPDIRLEHIHRQAADSGIISFAHHLREEKDPYTWEHRPHFQSDIDEFLHKPDVTIVPYDEFKLGEPFKDFDAVLAGTNRRRISVNKSLREKLGHDNEKLLPEPGEPLLILRNNYTYGVFNGQIVYTKWAHAEKGMKELATVCFVTDDGDEVIAPLHRPQFFCENRLDVVRQRIVLADFGYCCTTHKYQGSEADRIVVLEESVFSDARWRYTAATRAAKRLTYVPHHRDFRGSVGKLKSRPKPPERKKDPTKAKRMLAKMKKRTRASAPTSVVNMREEEYDVYIGRPGKGEDGYFGNPVRVGEKCSICHRVHKKGGETLMCFKVYFDNRVKSDPEFAKRVEELRGKKLGCFCKPRLCHGDVIVGHLERQKNE